MSLNRRADAYARQHAPLFISRYIEAVKAGNGAVVPAEIRGAVEAYAQGRKDTSGVDINAWVYRMLYEHRTRSSVDLPLPASGSVGKEVAKAAGAAALGFGVTLLKQSLSMGRLFR